MARGQDNEEPAAGPATACAVSPSRRRRRRLPLVSAAQHDVASKTPAGSVWVFVERLTADPSVSASERMLELLSNDVAALRDGEAPALIALRDELLVRVLYPNVVRERVASLSLDDVIEYQARTIACSLNLEQSDTALIVRMPAGRRHVRENELSQSTLCGESIDARWLTVDRRGEFARAVARGHLHICLVCAELARDRGIAAAIEPIAFRVLSDREREHLHASVIAAAVDSVARTPALNDFATLCTTEARRAICRLYSLRASQMAPQELVSMLCRDDGHLREALVKAYGSLQDVPTAAVSAAIRELGDSAPAEADSIEYIVQRSLVACSINALLGTLLASSWLSALHLLVDHYDQMSEYSHGWSVLRPRYLVDAQRRLVSNESERPHTEKSQR